MGTSFCSTSATWTSGEAFGAPNACFDGSTARTINPITIKHSTPPIASVRFLVLFIFSLRAEDPTPQSMTRGLRAVQKLCVSLHEIRFKVKADESCWGK